MVVLGEVTFTRVQVADVPVQFPVHPVNFQYVEAGVALSTTVEPVSKLPVHVLPQTIALFELFTVPPALFVFVTVTEY